MKHLTENLKFLHKNFGKLCADCNGMGHVADKECKACDATGYKGSDNIGEELYENSFSRYHYDRNNPDFKICDHCGGMGHIHENECHACDATGLVQTNTPQLKKNACKISKPQAYKIKDRAYTLCSVCEGQGHIDDKECSDCGATGLKQRTAMKYDIGHYAKLYQKHFSSDKRTVQIIENHEKNSQEKNAISSLDN